MAFTITGGSEATPLTAQDLVDNYTQVTWDSSRNNTLLISDRMDFGVNCVVDLTGSDIVFTGAANSNYFTVRNSGAVFKYGRELPGGMILPGGTIRFENRVRWAQWSSQSSHYITANGGKLEFYGAYLLYEQQSFAFFQDQSNTVHTLKDVFISNFGGGVDGLTFFGLETSSDSYIELLTNLQPYGGLPAINNIRSNYSGNVAILGPTPANGGLSELTNFTPTVGTGETLVTRGHGGGTNQYTFNDINATDANIIAIQGSGNNQNGTLRNIFNTTYDIKCVNPTGAAIEGATVEVVSTADHTIQRALGTTDANGEFSSVIQTYQQEYTGNLASWSSWTVTDTSLNTVDVRKYDSISALQEVTSIGSFDTITISLSADTNVTLSEAEAGALTGISIQPNRVEDGELRPAIIITESHSENDIYDFWKYWYTRPENYQSDIVLSVVNNRLQLGDYSAGREKFYELVVQGAELDKGSLSGWAPGTYIDYDYPASTSADDNVEDYTGIVLIDPRIIVTNKTVDLAVGNMVLWIDTSGTYTLTGWTIQNQNSGNKIIFMIRAAGVNISTNIPVDLIVNGTADSNNIATWSTFTSTHSATILKIADDLTITGTKVTDTVILTKDRDGTDLFIQYPTPLTGGNPVTFTGIAYSEVNFSAWLIVNSEGGGRIEFPVTLALDNGKYTVNGIELDSNNYDVGTNTSIGVVAGQVGEIKKRVDDNLDSPVSAASITTAQIDSIATAVETAILDEEDGRKIIDAIVTKIGNENISTSVLVAAIRADIEREGGFIELIKKKTDQLVFNDKGDLVTQATAIVQTEFNSFMDNLPATIKDTFKGGSFSLDSTETNKIVNAILDAPYGTRTDGGALGQGTLGEHWYQFYPPEIIRQLLTYQLNGIANPTRYQPVAGVYGDGTFGDSLLKILDNNTGIADANSALTELKTLVDNQDSSGLTPEQANTLESIKATVEAIPYIDEQEITNKIETLLTELRAFLSTVTPENPPDNTQTASITFVQGDTGNVAFNTTLTSIDGDLFFSVGIDVGDLIHQLFEVPATFNQNDSGGTITAIVSADNTARLRYGTDYKFEVSNTKSDGTKSRVIFGDVIITKSVS